MQTISEHLGLLSSVIDTTNVEISDIIELRIIEPSEMRPKVERVASAINAFSMSLDEVTPEYADNTSNLIDDIRKMIDLSEDFAVQDDGTINNGILITKSTVETLLNGMGSAKASIIAFINSISSIGRMTSSLNKAKRRLSNSVAVLTTIMDNDEAMLSICLDEIEGMLKRLD